MGKQRRTAKVKPTTVTPQPYPTTFGELSIGDHFMSGEREYVRLPIVPTGTTLAPGYVNAARVGDAMVSGFGPHVVVAKLLHDGSNLG
jgi:hypothetical protein